MCAEIMTVKDLNTYEYHPYYETYIGKTNNQDLRDGLQNNSDQVLSFLNSIPDHKLEYRYSEGKWTIKEMILHIIDTERIFSYRALRIARQDKKPLQSFDQDAYVPHSLANMRSFQNLLEEYRIVRQATVSLFESFDDRMLLQIGMASDSPISVRALGFILIGHENHHCQLIRERYL